MKLIHDRWALVAPSDAEASCLSLSAIGELLRENNRDATAIAYLPGPVGSGVVDIKNDSVATAANIRSKYVLRRTYVDTTSDMKPDSLHNKELEREQRKRWQFREAQVYASQFAVPLPNNIGRLCVADHAARK